MTTRVKLVLPLTLAAALVSSSAGAQTQPTLQGWSKDGVVWNDASSWPTLEDLARASAPVLWFSPDEFLLREGLPAPGEIGSTSRRAVYYRAARIRTSGKVHPEWKACLSRPACRLAGGVEELTIRFMFYYPEDRGFGPHIHDLEVTDVKVALSALGQGARARLVYVAGAAHGVGWYTNELTLAKGDGVKLPLHLFVEQGKHASAPDRNGDGNYEHGVDVNELPIDAWGVRDRTPFSFRMGSGFDPRMFTRREPDSQVWPDHNQPAGREVKTYQLVHSISSPFCQPDGDEWRLSASQFEEKKDSKDSKDLDRLRGFLADKDFCDGPHKPSKNEGLPLWLGGTIIRPFGSVMERLSGAYRFDQGRSGFAMAGPLFRIPKIDGWLAAKLNMLYEDRPVTTEKLVGTVWEGHTIANDVGQFDLFYTRSAGRLVDWYASVGLDSHAIQETISGFDVIVDQEQEANVEGGIHVRFPLPDGLKERLHVPFIGVRLGVRSEPKNAAERTRLVFEVGLGAW